jgi:hypothetical protein
MPMLLFLRMEFIEIARVMIVEYAEHEPKLRWSPTLMVKVWYRDSAANTSVQNAMHIPGK